MAFCIVMPFKMMVMHRGVSDVHRTMTVGEFKEWIRQFDRDGDGRISRDELRRAMRAMRMRFTGWKAKRGISYADADGDGYIDDGEIDGLVQYAQRSLGLRIVPY